MTSLTLRDVALEGRGRVDVRIEGDRIAAIDADLPRSGVDLDGRGGALIPGLIDHHIHLFATATKMASVDLADAGSPAVALDRLRDASLRVPPGAWLRAVGYDDADAPLWSREHLDAVAPSHPVRVQDRTGALWILNSQALDLVLTDAAPAGLEHDAAGRPTGRLWREDAWVRARLGADPPSLAALGAALAACGVTGVIDAGASNGPDEARLLAAARARGELPQHLTLMGREDLPPGEHYTAGPLKLLFDERDLPDLHVVVERIGSARRQQRAVAVHCVTAGELTFTLAAFHAAGARAGDRVEHGSVIPESAIAEISALGLTVVTQPHFIAERGERYRRTVEECDLPDLYRLASLASAGIPLAAGSDAPYGGFDPWASIAAAVHRRSGDGAVIGAGESLGSRRALGLYLGAARAPGGPERALRVGAPADLCLLTCSLAEALAAPNAGNVAATIIEGRLAYTAN